MRCCDFSELLPGTAGPHVFRRMLTSSLAILRPGLSLTRSLSMMSADRMVDSQYPGTAVARMLAARDRAKELTPKDVSCLLVL